MIRLGVTYIYKLVSCCGMKALVGPGKITLAMFQRGQRSK